MKPKKSEELPQLFTSRLDQILDLKHPLCLTARSIDWQGLDDKLGSFYVEEKGAPAKPTRLLVGLHYIKHTFNESDESVVDRFVENPYWQYFCGFEYFQHRFPIHPTSMTRWRQRIGEQGVETLLSELLKTAQRREYLNGTDLKRVVIDTTVQEKAIAFPTDARLYDKMRRTLVREARKRGIVLRQSYSRVGKQILQRQHGYAHAKQFKRARKQTKLLKTLLGRVQRDILRKATHIDDELQSLLDRCQRLLDQKRADKNKLYSVHAPEVECICKGKVHKRYEFGCKVSFVTTARDGWIVGSQALHGNPWDGHTLNTVLEQSERLSGQRPELALVDLGYRGHNYAGDVDIKVVNLRRVKQMTYYARRWLKRRSSIEPIIGHAKQDHRMDRNYLKGKEGDKINALLAACGFNLRKLIRAFLRHFWGWFMEVLLGADQKRAQIYHYQA